jgi:hypothetical protein
VDCPGAEGTGGQESGEAGVVVVRRSHGAGGVAPGRGEMWPGERGRCRLRVCNGWIPTGW